MRIGEVEEFSQEEVDQWRAYFELKRKYQEEEMAEFERDLDRKRKR